MSVESWKEEFGFPEDHQFTSELEAAQASLRTWQGWLPGNLEKHGLRQVKWSTAIDSEDNQIHHGHADCALCRLHRCMGGYDCSNCVLSKLHKSCNHEASVYWQIVQQKHRSEFTPIPMIRELERAVNLLKKS